MGGVTKSVGKLVGGVLGTGGSAPSVEAPATVDPEAERKKAEQEAAAAANSQAAERTRQRRSNSLLASSGSNTQQAQTSSVLAYGKNKLGE